MKRWLLLSALGVIAVSAVGCRTYSGGVAPSSVPLEQGTYTPGRSVAGASWGVHLLYMIPVTAPSTSEALEEAVRANGGRPIIQVTADTRRYYWVPLVFLERIQVEGYAAMPDAAD
ncbi:MAG: hypothetical protein R6V58_01625 [Planctomycetota bacterium]